MMTEDEMREFIRDYIEKYCAQKILAKEIGISESLMSRILNGKRSITDDVAKFFSRRRVVFFVIPDVDRKAE